MSMRLLTAAVLAFVLVGCLVIALVSFAPDAFGNGSAHGELSFSRIVLDAKQSPWGKAIGDMDGDGFPDVLAGFACGGVYWYAYPTWTKHFIGNNGGDDLQVADINNDGAVDVITNGEQIVWYENPRGDGGDPGANRWRKHVIDSTTGLSRYSRRRCERRWQSRCSNTGRIRPYFSLSTKWFRFLD
jgi:FG-GAP-like repeat